MLQSLFQSVFTYAASHDSFIACKVLTRAAQYNRCELTVLCGRYRHSPSQGAEVGPGSPRQCSAVFNTSSAHADVQVSGVAAVAADTAGALLKVEADRSISVRGLMETVRRLVRSA